MFGLRAGPDVCYIPILKGVQWPSKFSNIFPIFSRYVLWNSYAKKPTCRSCPGQCKKAFCVHIDCWQSTKMCFLWFHSRLVERTWNLIQFLENSTLHEKYLPNWLVGWIHTYFLKITLLLEIRQNIVVCTHSTLLPTLYWRYRQIVAKN